MPSSGRTAIALLFWAFITNNFVLAEQVQLGPLKDNTLYQKSGSLSNGSGMGVFAGRTGDGNIVRALLAFDLHDIPVGSTIEDVSLTLRQTNTNNNTAQSRTVSLHRLTKDWGEEASDATLGGGGGGAGGPAITGDATWLHRFFDTDLWDNPGGDFATEASGSVEVAGNGDYVWRSARMVEDVQAWVDDSASNFGWLLRGAEDATATAKRFGSRESSSPPVLLVQFTTPGNGQQLTHALYFPQFGTGDGFFSQITLLNPDTGNPVSARIIARNDDGAPFPVTLNGTATPQGIVELQIPPGGIRVLKTEAAGSLQTGSVTVLASAPLGGSVVFGGVFGAAGVLGGGELPGGFTGPVESFGAEVRTGVAIQNPGSNEATVSLELFNAEGGVLATAQVDLPAFGKIARFVDELAWDNAVDFSNFNGSLRVAAPSAVAAVMLQNRFVNGVSQFLTLPVLAR